MAGGPSAVRQALNALEEAHLRGLFEYYDTGLRQSLERLEAADTPDRRATVLEFVRGKATEAVLIAWGLGESPAAVRRFFRTAAWAARELFEIPDAPRWKNPVALLDAVHQALIVNEREDAQRLAEVARYRA